MLTYILRRFILALVTILAITVLSFTIIQLPPGDYVDSYLAEMSSSGSGVTQEDVLALRQQYGLDQPIYVQYAKWMGKMIAG